MPGLSSVSNDTQPMLAEPASANDTNPLTTPSPTPSTQQTGGDPAATPANETQPMLAEPASANDTQPMLAEPASANNTNPLQPSSTQAGLEANPPQPTDMLPELSSVSGDALLLAEPPAVASRVNHISRVATRQSGESQDFTVARRRAQPAACSLTGCMSGTACSCVG